MASIVHIGMLVRNVEEAGRILEESIGIGPFEIAEPKFHDSTVNGKPQEYRVRLGHARAGSTDIVLIQPLPGENAYKEFLERKGYGVHHLAIETDNVARSTQEMTAKGFKVIQSGSRPGIKFVYFNTEEQTGITFEFIEFVEKKQA
jgi:catechol 2,3-dioxygenase-like lactoylglutathione lyase family enzyme